MADENLSVISQAIEDATNDTGNAAGAPVVLFVRAEGFYPIELLDPARCGRTLAEQAADHAVLNPGTLRVEDITGNILWRPQ